MNNDTPDESEASPSSDTATVTEDNVPSTHIMVDIETLGTKVGSVVLSIGVVKFDPITEHLSDPTAWVINMEDSLRNGFTVDPSTLLWWTNQSEAARDVLVCSASCTRSNPIITTLNELNNYINNCPLQSDVFIWGNGSDFDNAHIVNLYNKLNHPMSPRWTYRSNRCYRTLRALAPTVAPINHGEAHNALDDAIAQAKTAIAISKRLGIQLG